MKISLRYHLSIIFLLIIIIVTLYSISNNLLNSPHRVMPVSTTTLDILFAGDMMLDRNVRNTIDKNGFDNYFYKIADIIRSADITIVNLEGPFTDNPSITQNLNNHDLQFTFDPEMARKLSELGFDIVNLANNHTLNFGRAGLELTKKYVIASGMQYYGDPNNLIEISTSTSKNGISVGLIGFHEFSYINTDKIINEIIRLRPVVDILIVTPHWGVEYQKEPSSLQKRLAYEFIDKGADIVIGTHPHVIGDIEEYKGKKIYYSLGNFAFDQYFSNATSRGLIVNVLIQKHDNEISLKFSDSFVKINREGIVVE